MAIFTEILPLVTKWEDIKYNNNRPSDDFYLNIWNKIGADNIPSGIALIIFDGCLVHGIQTMVSSVQRIIGVNDDGVVGDKTLKAIEAATNVFNLIIQISNSRRILLSNPNQDDLNHLREITNTSLSFENPYVVKKPHEDMVPHEQTINNSKETQTKDRIVKTINKKAFYDSIRKKLNLTTQNVEGMEKLLNYALEHETDLNTQKLAYVIATAWWESAQTMHPVKEAYWKDENWRKRNLRYFPFYGRGLIQTTWDYNYKKIGDLLGVDLVKNPDLLLEFEYALPAIFVGMRDGLYTGKDLNDYIDDKDESDSEDLREYTNARRIVNGTDKASTIGNLALTFEHALQAAGY